MMQLKSILNRIILAICLCAAFIAPQLPAPVAASATVIYVNDDASGSNNGSTWANAYTSLQAAINDANSTTKEIWVAAGKYVPTTRFVAALARSETFQLKSGLKIYGGFAGAETALNQRDPAANLTILSGDIDNNDSQNPITDMSSVTGNTTNAFHVVMGATGAILDGFTITGGYANGGSTNSCDYFPAGPSASHYCGGGMWNISANTTVTNVVFSGNYGQYGGGGMGNTTSSPTLTNVTFQNNSAYYGGGGMLNTGSNPTLTSVSFNSNYARTNGGGMYSQGGGSATLTEVTFTNNSAPGNLGGGIVLSDSNLTVKYGTFRGNSSRAGGGGIAAWSGSSVITLENVIFSANVSSGSSGGGIMVQNNALTITNGLFSGNQAMSGGGLSIGGTAILTNVTITGNRATDSYSGQSGGIVSWNGTHQMRNSIVWGNGPNNVYLSGATLDISYSLLQGGCPGGGTCDHITTSDPLFTSPLNYTSAPSTAGNLRLLPSSPAIDAGNNNVASPALAASDLDHNGRRMDTPGILDTGSGSAPVVDLGAYEFPGIAPDLTSTLTHDAGASPQVGASFHWTLTVANTGNGIADFSNGQTVLQDPLPASSLVSYGTPVVQNISGLSGTLNCAIASDILTCTANGAVSLAATTGQFKVELPVTATTVGTLTNPPGAGVCSVDPNNTVPETNEINNTCAASSLTIGARTPILVTAMHDTAHTVITSGPLGSTVHGNIQLSDSAGYTPVPGGQVNVRVYAGLACQGTPLSAENHTLSASGQTDSGPYPLSGSFSYEVDYLGDAIYNPVSQTCTDFLAYQANPTLTVNTLLDDTGDGLCTDLHCTLREAIAAANTLTGDNTILFSVEGTIPLTSALPHVSESAGLTIDAQARKITVSGGSLYRILYVDAGASLTLDHLTLANGSAADGGGVRNDGNLVVTNSLFLNNHATGMGGAIANATSATLANVSNTTFSGNGATDGSAILNQGGSLTVTHSTFAGSDTSGSVLYTSPASINSTVTNSLLARGLATQNCNVAPTSATNNLIDDGSCGSSPATLGLDSLGDHGGATATYNLLFDSPAIDTGDPANCATVDQRGQIRDDWQCDIGAFELKLTDSTQVKRLIPGSGVYTFGPTLVKLDFTSIGELKSGLVEYYAGPHPTGQTGTVTSGVGWGPYYTLSGQGDAGAVNTGFVAQVTLPLPLPRPSEDDPYVCKYLGSDWNCSRTGRDTQWVWRDTIHSFSDWTVGEHITPTAIRLMSLSATNAKPSAALLPGILALLAGMVVWHGKSR
jgi:CSLREA domain-containing protein